MKENVVSDILRQMVADARFHPKLIELYFLARDEEVGRLTWKIASLPTHKRAIVSQLIHVLSEDAALERGHG